MPKYDAVPAGDVRPGNFMEDLWRDLRYAAPHHAEESSVRSVCGADAGLGDWREHHGLHGDQYADPESAAGPRLLPNWRRLHRGEAESTSKSGAPLPISYADLKDYQARNGVFRSLAGYTSPRVVTWQTGVGVAADVQRIRDRQLLFDTGTRARQGTLLFAGRGQHSRERTPSRS